ncbi:WXG100 family type VII secretion target [Nocardia sp. GCM10030253]|uniref:WXG100 family type VII secretion target n=1 Tax=Nocardia sp. GCM10030253 TaxID=3273404 RepID=UPI0036284D43
MAIEDPTVAGLTIVDGSAMNTAGGKTSLALGTLESHLKGLASCQDELHAAIKGETGTAIYITLGNAHEKGTELARFLDDIREKLANAKVKMESADFDAKQRVLASMGNDGNVDTGGAGGSWANGAQEVATGKVSTAF